MNFLLALLLLITTIPLWLFLYILVKITSKGPFIFKQKRLGKDRKMFTMYKIRTMVEGAERLKKKYAYLNEIDGPTFKIKNDPRFTKIGRLISHTGIDELPQLINVLKGEMSLVGPRPLPVNEALKVPKKYEGRFSVLPGMTSLWVVKGAHRLGFDTWMQLDVEYLKKKSLLQDLLILSQTSFFIIKLVMKKMLHTQDRSIIQE